MATVKEQFAEAKRYIDAGQYGEARKVLKQIKSPDHQVTVKKWLAKLDTLDIPEPDMVIGAAPKRQPSRQGRMVLLVVLLVVFIAALVILRINFQNGYADAMQQLGH